MKAKIYLLTAALLGASLLKGEPLTIVENGQPRAAIVVAADEPKADQAALELQKYFERMSGARVPIVKEGEPVAASISILVGHTAAAQKLGVKIPSGFNPAIRPEAFEEEGYVLQTRGKSIVVGGNSDGPYQGTIYAACALLEKLGCRWFFPGDWGEVVPKQATITVPDLNVSSRPDFAMRNIWISGWVEVSVPEMKTYGEWALRNGFCSAKGFYAPVGDGFLAGLLPPSEYAEKHPEYYAMNQQGKRAVTPKDQPFGMMLCLSNPEVFTASVERLKESLAGKKKTFNVSPAGFGISPPDGAPYCYCEKCEKTSHNFNYPTYAHRRMASEEFFEFASKLAREFPDKWCSTYAYALREMPPQGVVLPPNVTATYAPISSCVVHPGDDPACWRRQETMRLIEEWRRLTPHVIIYDYNPGFLTGSFVPERDVANFAVNAGLYKKIGIKGVNAEGRKAFMQGWISYYMRAKLLWDSKADVTALKKDFYNTFFGAEAGPHVQAWWDACEAALVQTTIHPHEDWLVNHIYTVEFARKIHEHVEAARKAKMTDEQRARFEAFAIIADHLEAFAAVSEAEKNMEYGKASSAAARMMDDQGKLSKIYSFFITPSKVPYNFFPLGRKKKFDELVAITDGAKGAMVAPLPLEMKFSRDRFNEGVIGEWYRPDFDDKGWETRNTYLTWDQQDKPEDAKGHDYDGFGWYRATFEVPAQFKDKPVRFWSGGVINEAWVWVNGKYAGHKTHAIWWMHPHDFELDVGALVKPGRNTIAIRVWNDAEIGGLYRRGFFWSPKEGVATAAQPAKNQPPSGGAP